MLRRSMAALATMGLVLSLGTVAEAAPSAKLVQYKIPSANSSPRSITQASDGNMWFTESFVNDQSVSIHNVARVTPQGEVSEFAVCDFCFPTDIVQGSDGVLYYTKNDAPLGRLTTDGTVLPDASEPFSFNGNGLDAHGDDIWITDFNNRSIRRYDIPTGAFTEYGVPDPNAIPIDVAGFPRQISLASDGSVWFTERFTPQAVGRVDAATLAVSLFPLDGGPEGIAPGANGSMWVTRSTADNVVQMSADGVIIAASKVVKGSEPFGITVSTDGDPWFTMLSGNKIATLDLTPDPPGIRQVGGEKPTPAGCRCARKGNAAREGSDGPIPGRGRGVRPNTHAAGRRNASRNGVRRERRTRHGSSLRGRACPGRRHRAARQGSGVDPRPQR